MPKMTAEAFASLDPEVQEEILKRVPADQLNKMSYADVNENLTINEAYDNIFDLYTAIPSPEGKFLLFIKTLESLADVMANHFTATKGMEPPPKPMAMMLLMTSTMDRVQKMLNEINKNQEEGE